MSKYTKEYMSEIVSKSYSMREVISFIGIAYSGGNFTHLKRIINSYGIDMSHFTGSAWNRGKKIPKLKPEDYLVYSESPRYSYKVKTLILRDKVKEHKCESCNNYEWIGRPIPLELHHVNGNKKDNRLENLQFLCPNCHSLTDNYSGKTKKKSNNASVLQRQRDTA